MNANVSTIAPLVAFDLDDTLAPSKGLLAEPMAHALAALLERTSVAVISGGQFSQFRSQLVEPLENIGAAQLDRLHLMPACGTQYYRYNGDGWKRVYIEALGDEEKGRALTIIEMAARELDYWPSSPWGAPLEDRESQITFSALGQEAPLKDKEAWDPTGEKKRRLRERIAPLLPELEVRAGGSTSIDITRRGRDKSYGITRLLDATKCDISDVLFFGDQLQEGGNDHPVLAMGIRCVAVSDWQHTLREVNKILRD